MRRPAKNQNNERPHVKPTLILNDTHVGVSRMAGTTPTSASALKAFLHERLAACLYKGYNRVIINGDLTDSYDIGLGEALEVYATLDQFLAISGGRELIVALGNHDLSKDSAKLGTVAFIGRLLEMKYPDRFKLVDAPHRVDDVYIIPHVTNQALFDLALSQVPDDVSYLLVHANFDNNFAAQSDHSLNLTREQAREVTSKGITLIFGHEHQGRTAFGGKLVIVGNQFPSSVSDCLAHGDGQLDGAKYALAITGGGKYEKVMTWSRDDTVYGYTEIDWRDLNPEVAHPAFVRVAGTAEAEEAAAVIKAISGFRQKSEAFVVTNAVKVSQLADSEEMDVSAEDVRSVNVIQMLLDVLTEEQAAVVRQLMEEVE